MIKKILIGLITYTRPLLGPPGCCRFPVTCSKFAILQLEQKTIPVALWNITKRLLSCHPFHGFFTKRNS